MRHRTVTATAMLAVAASITTAHAQNMADDATISAQEPLETIELPAELPEKPRVNLNWDCDVLLLSTAQRYRPGSCHQDDDADQPGRELEVERVSMESAENPRRKMRN